MQTLLWIVGIFGTVIVVSMVTVIVAVVWWVVTEVQKAVDKFL